MQMNSREECECMFLDSCGPIGPIVSVLGVL